MRDFTVDARRSRQAFRLRVDLRGLAKRWSFRELTLVSLDPQRSPVRILSGRANSSGRGQRDGKHVEVYEAGLRGLNVTANWAGLAQTA
jgi:hypothetical protein